MANLCEFLFPDLKSTSGCAKKEENVCINLERTRKLVRRFLDQHHYQAALFWADKLCSLSNEETEDVYLLAQCMYQTKQYHRGAVCIKSKNLHKKDAACAYLAARCHFFGKDYQEALEVIDTFYTLNGGQVLTKSDDDHKPNVLGSSLQLLRGQIYEAMDNRSLAVESYREALRLDVFCYEAFHALVQHHMLSKEEEESLIASLPFANHCTDSETELVRFLYVTQLKKYDKPSSLVVPSQFAGLQQNMDLATALAERYYYNCDYQQCFKITTAVLTKDAYHTQCLPIHISCLVELRKSNVLFYLAHKLVDLYPESAISWFAVGCYYLLINKTDAARRYLSKATILDRVFGPAWLVYGHSFAVENEHDQAMAAYFKASQLMKGCHLPLLYIGLEYGLTNNTKLAERFFTQALTIAPEDPFVLHELGVVVFQISDFELAEQHFRAALDKIESIGDAVKPEKWEPLLNNLGHTCRKLKKYDEALYFHQQALVLCPQNAASFSAIGYVYALMENWDQAVEYFHKALGFQRDDTFSTTMLSHVIEHLMNEMSPCDDLPDEIPTYTSSMNKSTISTISEETEGQATEENMSVSMEFEVDTSAIQ